MKTMSRKNLDNIVNALTYDIIDSILMKELIYRPKILLDECVNHKLWYNTLRTYFDKNECGIQHVCKLGINGYTDKEIIKYAHNRGYELIITSDAHDFPKENIIKKKYPDIKKRIFIKAKIAKCNLQNIKNELINKIENFVESRNKKIKESLSLILGVDLNEI